MFCNLTTYSEISSNHTLFNKARCRNILMALYEGTFMEPTCWDLMTLSYPVKWFTSIKWIATVYNLKCFTKWHSRLQHTQFERIHYTAFEESIQQRQVAFMPMWILNIYEKYIYFIKSKIRCDGNSFQKQMLLLLSAWLYHISPGWKALQTLCRCFVNLILLHVLILVL